MLEQCCPKVVSSFRAARPPLGLRSKRSFGLIPLRGAGVDESEFQLQPRNFGALANRFTVFLFSLWHLPKHKIVFTHCLVRSGRIRMGADERIDGALGEQTAGAPEIIQQVWIIGPFDQGRAEVCNCLLILPRLDLSDSQSLKSVNALKMRNGFGGITQRQQSVAELQVCRVEIGLQLESLLKGCNFGIPSRSKSRALLGRPL